MATTRVTFMMDESLAEQARRLGVDISAAARAGVAAATRSALAEADRVAYRQQPEQTDELWAAAERWTEE